MLPPFDDAGNLPPGIHPCSVAELVERFGSGSEERETEISELLHFIEAAKRSRRGNPMTEILTAEAYEHTKEKLRDLESRLAAMEKRSDLHAEHLASVRRSYKMMIREYLQEIKLYEAKQAKRHPSGPA
jgi:ribonuclease D